MELVIYSIIRTMSNPSVAHRVLARPVFIGVPKARRLLLREGAMLIDARTDRDVATGRAEGSVAWPARDVHPLVDGNRRPATPEDIGRQARQRGVHAAPVVIYGTRGGADAAHLWWTLTAYGHDATYLLDGGLEAWRRACGPVTTEAPVDPHGGTFEPASGPAAYVSAEEIAASMGREGLMVLDTRSTDEYSGAIAAAARGGHIPGAHHVDWERALTGDGRLLPREDLERIYARFLAAQDVVTYCQSGVRAAHTLAVLQHLGNRRANLYLGSWGEWGNRQDLPVARPSSRPPIKEDRAHV